MVQRDTAATLAKGKEVTKWYSTGIGTLWGDKVDFYGFQKRSRSAEGVGFRGKVGEVD